MSYNRGLAAINCKFSDKIPHSQFMANDEFILKYTGIDTKSIDSTPWSEIYKDMDVYSFDTPRSKIDQKIAKILDYDIVWTLCEMPISGRYTSMGHASWDQFDKKDDNVFCPFKSSDDVLSFDPVEEYGMQDFDVVLERFRKHVEDGKKAYPDAVLTAGRYNTLFSACIRTFGWEMFLSSVPHNEAKFDRILEGFLELSLLEARAWAQTDLEVYLCHDDIVWTSGAVFNPVWYRKYIFPKYKRLWQPLKENGKKVLFFADGNYSDFIDDIFEAGADGIGFEPHTSLDYAVKKYGKGKFIWGNADCRILQFKGKEEIKEEVKRCVNAGKNYPGYIMGITNLIANKIPVENIEYFFKCFEELRQR